MNQHKDFSGCSLGDAKQEVGGEAISERERESSRNGRSAHTPGPWSWFTKAEPDTENAKLVHTQERVGDMCQRYLVGSNGQGFAHTVGMSHEQDEANARLIAAAPDLLEALEGAERVLAKHVYPKPDVDADHPFAVLTRIRAALRKAKDEEAV